VVWPGKARNNSNRRERKLLERELAQLANGCSD